ncbi:dihydroorotate dehydrogenase B (NAD(+)), catalytic subunit [Clostridia bacterium]|nr:dihydroorotate dehydrogenase B (NAD(+)), catalytic subunit [Clostridia bacterium]
MNCGVKLGNISLKSPLLPASGTFASGKEYSEFVDLNSLGAVVTKGVSAQPWSGNPMPRIAETASGMLNAIGLQNAGVEHFIQEDLPFLKQMKAKIIVNICGKTIEDYLQVVERLSSESVDFLEINISCPNIKEGGIAFGQNAQNIFEITSLIKKKAKQPIMIKLSPNVTDIKEMAKAAQEGGADAISLINTLTGTKIDIHQRKFVLANQTGGLSGPAIKPIALNMVYQAAQAVSIPLIGMGGIQSGEDAIEFLMAGATAVAVGTSLFRYPGIFQEILLAIQDYMRRYKVKNIKDIIGIL